MNQDIDLEQNISLVFTDFVKADCEDGYLISIIGLGAAPLRYATETIEISCPFQDEISGTYGGVKASVGVGGHVSGAVFIGVVSERV